MMEEVRAHGTEKKNVDRGQRSGIIRKKEKNKNRNGIRQGTS